MIACAGCGKPIGSTLDAIDHGGCSVPTTVRPGLTHDWYVHRVTSGTTLTPGWYVLGGQPDDEGNHPYVIHVQDGEVGAQVAAEQIAAALRGEA